jgi:CBS domain-containing protein
MTALRHRLPQILGRRRNRFLLPAAGLATTAAAALAFAYRWRARPSERHEVRDVMINDVLTIDASATLVQAAQVMRDGNVGVLPVVEDGRLRGIVTDRDLVVRGMAEGSVPSMTRVSECATWDIVCARANSSIEEAMEVMADSRIGRLPVVDVDNRVIGILTLSSLALRSNEQDEALETAQEVSKRSARAA